MRHCPACLTKRSRAPNGVPWTRQRHSPIGEPQPLRQLGFLVDEGRITKAAEIEAADLPPMPPGA